MNENEKEDILKVYREVKSKGVFTYLRELESFKNDEFYKFYLQLKANRQVVSILKYNYSQLISLVNHHNSLENQPQVWNDTNPKYRWRQQRMITTKLFNYLTSVFATVDYSRSHLEKKLSQNLEIADYFNLSKEVYFIKNPQHRFIQDLRNYTSHNSYLKVATQRKFNPQIKKIEQNIYLSKKELLSSGKWCSLSKDFINSQGTEIYIIDIIKAHFPLFLDFQNWTYLALLRVNINSTLEFKTKLQSILQSAEKVNMDRITLPFGHSYIRYLDRILIESESICSSKFNYTFPAQQV